MGTIVMEDFIHDIRTDREREKAEYREKGYIVSSNYLCLSKVDFICDKTKYSYSVQVDKNEIRFFLSNCNANLYLSIYEIYEVLRDLPDRKRAMFKNVFTRHILDSVDTECKFLYKGVSYELSPCVKFPNGKMILAPVGLEIDCSQFYYLIHLVQNKSNSMFERSKEERKKDNINGIYRLFSALLRKRSGSSVLSDKGWIWDPIRNKFILDSEQRGRDVNKWKEKYYLTDDEYKSILGIKKS